jgi:sulfoacetaldehyde dehydrogenase
VRRAYSSGTPAIGVGAGNVSVIVDETADIGAAARRIVASKTFDNATSCSSENAVIVVDAVYDAFTAALSREGGAVLPEAEAPGIVDRLWSGGHLDRHVIARDAEVAVERLGLAGRVPEGTRLIAVETEGVGAGHPLSGEKLSLVLALYRAADFDAARALAARLLAHQGAGHSVGLHSADPERALTLGRTLPTCRVIVNQPHCFATG